jgi:hypothetical protein
LAIFFAMNGEELKKFVPELLEGRYPGRSREAVPGSDIGAGDLGWILDLDDCLMLVRASQASNPFIWIRGGIAHGIPKTDALAWDIAVGNKDLVVGRVYAAYGDDVAMVVFDESIFAKYLSVDDQSSMEDVVNRFETSVQYTAQWTKTVREKFGGQAFSAEDWVLMSF